MKKTLPLFSCSTWAQGRSLTWGQPADAGSQSKSRWWRSSCWLRQVLPGTFSKLNLNFWKMKSMYLRILHGPVTVFNSSACPWGRQVPLMPCPNATLRPGSSEDRCPPWEQGGIKLPEFEIEIQKTSVQLPANPESSNVHRHISRFPWVSWMPQSSYITDQQLRQKQRVQQGVGVMTQSFLQTGTSFTRLDPVKKT